MQPDLLQQLRDIHLPADPGWWPPAPGWWLLALISIAGLVMFTRWTRDYLARRRPVKMARALHDKLYNAYRKGSLTGEAYLHESNELLKRLVIYGLGDNRARRANDLAWLEILDQWSGGNEFTTGAGRQLGNQRFRRDPELDIDTLTPLLEQFFRRVRA